MYYIKKIKSLMFYFKIQIITKKSLQKEYKKKKTGIFVKMKTFK